MKKIWNYSIKKCFAIIIIGFLFQINKVHAQITLDTIIPTTYTGIGTGFWAVQISASETKWYFQDTVNNTFSLYNMDFSPFMLNIAVPEPFDPSVHAFQALYISRALFDCDTSNIEYAYYDVLTAFATFRIMRTDGTVLFQLDSAGGPYCLGGCLGLSDVVRPIISTSAGTKLFLFRPTPSGGPNPIHVYSLCGTLPLDIFDFKEVRQSFVTIFPNPALNELTFKINLPDNLNEYELVIVNSNAQEIKREKLNRQQTRYLMDVSNLNSGVYFYTLSTKYKSYQSGKFVISK